MPSCCIHNKSIGHKSFRSCGRKWTTATVLCCHFAVQATKHRPFQQDRPCFLWFVILMACPFFRKLFCCTSFLFVPRKESKHDLQSLISKRQDPKSATETTQTLYLEAPSAVEARALVEANTPYNIEFIQELSGNFLEYEEKSANFKLTTF